MNISKMFHYLLNAVFAIISLSVTFHFIWNMIEIVCISILLSAVTIIQESNVQNTSVGIEASYLPLCKDWWQIRPFDIKVIVHR